MTLGKRIQEIRTAHGMSQEQFGELLDTSRQTVSKWELDQVVPDVRKIVAISRLFCVSTEDLLLHVTTFENEGVRFQCGVYRNAVSEIVETEKLAIQYYNRGKHILGAKLYEGNGSLKYLSSICEKDCRDGSVRYLYATVDERGEDAVVGNCEEYKKELGTPFDRKQLDKMECLESFLVNHGEYELHTVSQIGIRKCLEEWRKGVECFEGPEQLYVNICTGKTEYVYSIQKAEDNIYCGCSYNLPFELGLRSYGQFFRLRNYQDNSQDFCNCFYDFDYQIPREIKAMDYVKLGGNTQGENCPLCWFVKRYQENEIVLDGCGADEYIFRKNESKYERFV